MTYGYAAANFSGRMPCVEVADAIVGKVSSLAMVQLTNNVPDLSDINFSKDPFLQKKNFFCSWLEEVAEDWYREE